MSSYYCIILDLLNFDCLHNFTKHLTRINYWQIFTFHGLGKLKKKWFSTQRSLSWRASKVCHSVRTRTASGPKIIYPVSWDRKSHFVSRLPVQFYVDLNTLRRGLSMYRKRERLWDETVISQKTITLEIQIPIYRVFILSFPTISIS